MPLSSIEHYHSLVSLDTHPRRNASIFGYPSWVYKATNGKNGKVYCLRRLEGSHFIGYMIFSR
jgi:PAB-dependent poly(A)-specific ribonuclease subunit 3